MVSPGPDSSLVGKVLDDRYEVLEVIGGGGVGVVYSARRLKLERMVAVKVLHDTLVENAGLVARFQREAVAMSRLHHPHCIAVIDFGVYEERPFLVLEYVPGQTVAQLLQQGPFTAARAVSIALQLLETLEYFHSHHVIHRDLKSENVMLVESSGTADFVKVLDFGMAKILTGPGADSQLSKIGLVPGTPSAMAPEQIYQLPPDPRIDIYATGILLYEMIVGRRPFGGADMAATIKMQLSEPPKPPRAIRGEDALSEELEQVVMRALEKDRIDRYGTAAEMAAAVRLTPEGRAATAVPSNPVPSRPVSKPRRARWGLLAGLGSAVIALGAAAAVQLQPAERVPLPAKPAAAVLAPKVAPPVPPTPPPPAPVVETWLAHRDLAVTYSSRAQHDDAFREVQAALAESATAASADAALARAAVAALSAPRAKAVVEAFRSNPELPALLAETTTTGPTADLRHAAHEALLALGPDAVAKADLVAMWLLDLKQTSSCTAMRSVFKKLKASKDARFVQLKGELRSRPRKDAHQRCLKRLLRR